MEMTERSEEDACYALYECDNDVERAVVYLLENLEVGAFSTTTKKKKNKTTSADGAGDADEFESNNHQRDGGRDGNNDRSRNSRGNNRGRPDGGFNRGRSRPSGDSRDDRAMDRPGRGMGPRRGGFSGEIQHSSNCEIILIFFNFRRTRRERRSHGPTRRSKLVSRSESSKQFSRQQPRSAGGDRQLGSGFDASGSRVEGR